MTEFFFLASDGKDAKKAINIIDKKFKANVQANKVLYREITQISEDQFKVEIIFPFPDIRFIAWVFLAINLMILYFYRHLWILSANVVLFAAAYGIKYMSSPHFYFMMLKIGMKKNGYKGILMRF